LKEVDHPLEYSAVQGGQDDGASDHRQRVTNRALGRASGREIMVTPTGAALCFRDLLSFSNDWEREQALKDEEIGRLKAECRSLLNGL
jgi:hypothetical protein